MYLEVSRPAPGILAGLQNFPDTGYVLTALAQKLLVDRATDKVGRLEREIIATFVSVLNNCEFCANSHGATVVVLADGDKSLMVAIISLAGKGGSDMDSQHETLAKMQPLLQLAFNVFIKKNDMPTVQTCKDYGYSDEEIHDVILIVAAFNMFNYYVFGLGSYTLAERIGDIDPYMETGRALVAYGYMEKQPDLHAPIACPTSNCDKDID